MDTQNIELKGLSEVSSLTKTTHTHGLKKRPLLFFKQFCHRTDTIGKETD